MAKRKRQRKGVSGPSRARSTAEPVRKIEDINPPGRPTLYSDELGDRLCALIANGVPIRIAARSLGVGRSTLYEWRDAGEQGLAPYVTFAAKLERAQARVERDLTVSLVAAARKDWRAAAWWLERRRPERYSSKQTLRVEKPIGELSDAELDTLIAKHGYVRASTDASTDQPDSGGDTP